MDVGLLLICVWANLVTDDYFSYVDDNEFLDVIFVW